VNKIRPLHDTIIAQRIAGASASAGGIIIPETAKEKPTEALVIAVGPGVYNERGERTPMEVKVGDRILIGKGMGADIQLNGETYLMIHEDAVLAVLL
jgi:chaperonin GroES